MINVADILHEKGEQVWSIPPEASVGDALAIMSERNVGAVLVVGVDGRPVGILSERDIARAVLKEGTALAAKPVKDVMSAKVQCIPETLSIPEVMHVMTHNRFRHLPVTREGNLVGIVSIGDVVKAEIHEQEIVIDQLEHYIAGSL